MIALATLMDAVSAEHPPDENSTSSPLEDVHISTVMNRRLLLALLWFVFSVALRILMVMQEIDHYNPGILPLLEEFVSELGFTDAAWLEAYSILRNNTIGPQVSIHPISCRREERERIGGMRWIRLTLRDVFHFIVAQFVQEQRQVVMTPPGEVPSLHQAQLWFRCPRAFARFATILEWKHFFWIHPAQTGEIPDGFLGGLLPRRILDHNRPVPTTYRLDVESPQNADIITNLLHDPGRMIMIYGLNIIEIEGGEGRVVHLGEANLKRGFVACGLTFMLVLGIMINFPKLSPLLLFTLLPLLIQYRTHQMSAAQTQFFAQVCMQVERIEFASRHLVRGLVQDPNLVGKSIDVRLHYNDIQAWCRCNPVPPGEPAESRTWVEIMIPSKYPMYGRLFELLDMLLHSILPWGHSRNWSANLVYATTTLYATSRSLWLGYIGIALAVFARWFAPRTAWGDGDPWTLAWFTWVTQIICQGAASSVLADTFDAAKEMLLSSGED